MYKLTTYSIVPCGCVNERDSGIFCLFCCWLLLLLFSSMMVSIHSFCWFVFAVVVDDVDDDCLLLLLVVVVVVVVDITESHCLLSLLIWSSYIIIIQLYWPKYLLLTHTIFSIHYYQNQFLFHYSKTKQTNIDGWIDSWIQIG